MKNKKILIAILSLVMMLSLFTIPIYTVNASSGDGKSLKTAKPIEYGNWYSYTTSYNSTYLKVSNNKNGYYTITFKLPDGLKYNDIRLEIFDANGININCSTYAKTNLLTNISEYNIGLFAGTYYIKVTPSFYDKKLSYCINCYTYDYCETEPTASIQQAQNINLGYFYKGWMNDNGDYYKFYGQVGKTYRIYINNYTELVHSSAIMHLESANDSYEDDFSFLYDERDAKFDPTTMSFYFDFTLEIEGIHYLYLYNDSYSIPYTFALTTIDAPTPIAPTATKVTNSKKHIEDCSIIVVQSTMYFTDDLLEPTVIVKDGNTLLKSGKDYTIDYEDNYDIGYGTIIIKGINNYKGTTEEYFGILKDSSPKIDISYRSYVQSFGWQTWVKDGITSGTASASRRLEGLQIKLSKSNISGGVTYRTYVQKDGWKPWVKNGATSGTMGESKRIESMQIKLTGNIQKKYNIYYRVYAQKFGWLGWAKNGATSGTAGFGYRIESFQVKLVEKGKTGPTSNKLAYRVNK